jgi:hypothetical protein
MEDLGFLIFSKLFGEGQPQHSTDLPKSFLL